MALARQALATFPVADNQAQREFDFSDADFQALSKIAYEHAGIVLPDAKKICSTAGCRDGCARSGCPRSRTTANI